MRGSRRARAALAAVLVLIAAAVVGAWVWNDRQTRDVRGSAEKEFVLTESPELEVVLEPAQPLPPASAPRTPLSAPAPTPPASSPPASAPTPTPPAALSSVPEAPPAPAPVPAQQSPISTAAEAAAHAATTTAPRLTWSSWGLSPSRTRVVPREIALRPPFKRIWAIRSGSLMEYPPVVANGRLYVGTNLGRFLALEAESGEIVWEREFGLCIAASPALFEDIVLVSLMDPSPCKEHDPQAPGFLVALDIASGEERWRFEAGVIESSPLVVGGVVYIGSWDRRVYAIDARSGVKLWEFETGDRVKGGASFRDGTVFIGSYDGRVYALDAASGALVWSAAGQLGLAGRGRVYSTPALAYGRVFVANLDGKVYAYGATSGELIWSHSTGGFVYSSPAVWEEMVFVGSFDKHFYALDAVTGDMRWRFDAKGPIIGSPTVMDGLVYFSTTKAKTFALDARSGEVVWVFPAGEYSPLITDGQRVYIVGHSRLFAFEPAEPDSDVQAGG